MIIKEVKCSENFSLPFILKKNRILSESFKIPLQPKKKFVPFLVRCCKIFAKKKNNYTCIETDVFELNDEFVYCLLETLNEHSSRKLKRVVNFPLGFFEKLDICRE